MPQTERAKLEVFDVLGQHVRTPVIYRESELKELVGRSPEALRRIHAAKKALNGKVVATRDRN